jgi:hypothetical protein
VYIKDIVNALLATYKKIDMRLIVINNTSDIAFLKILLLRSENPDSKDVDFFNSLSSKLKFIQKILDVSYLNRFIDKLGEGVVEVNELSYPISSLESSYLHGNIETNTLYSKWTRDLYIKEEEQAIDNFPLLLIWLPFTSTCSGLLSSSDIPKTINGFDTSKIIHSFLDSSSINNSNNRIVLLLPVYCMLKTILSNFEIYIHKDLVNKISLCIINKNPKIFQLSDIISDLSSEIIRFQVQA